MKRYIWIVTAILVAFFSLIDCASTQEENREEIFFRSNKAFRDGNYKEAIDGYKRLIISGHGRGHVYYNLGNAYFRAGQIGRAILHYEKARMLIPRDADLNFNLRSARDKVQDAIPEKMPFINSVLFWIDSFSTGELFWGFAVLNILFWAVLLIRLFRRSEWSYYVTLILMVLWIVAGISFGSRLHQFRNDKRAVIVQKEVDVLSGPDINDTTLFKLHEGAVVHNERSENGWYLIQISEKKRGWIPVKVAENIGEKMN